MAVVKELLLDTLRELVDEELRTFQWFLYSSDFKGYAHIQRSRVDGLDREGTVDLLVQSYSYHEAVTVSLNILEKMRQKLWAEKLKEKYSQGKAAFTFSKT